MTSILKVSEIQDPTNSNTALEIDSSGIVTMPQNDSGWITPTLNSPFTHYSSPYGDVQYRKIGDIVNIQGLVNVNSASDGSTTFTLPSGYRPSIYIITSQKNGNTGEARVDVQTDGDVEMTKAANNATWLSLNITFMVA